MSPTLLNAGRRRRGRDAGLVEAAAAEPAAIAGVDVDVFVDRVAQDRLGLERIPGVRALVACRAGDAGRRQEGLRRVGGVGAMIAVVARVERQFEVVGDVGRRIQVDRPGELVFASPRGMRSGRAAGTLPARRWAPRYSGITPSSAMSNILPVEMKRSVAKICPPPIQRKRLSVGEVKRNSCVKVFIVRNWLWSKSKPIFEWPNGSKL